MTTPHWRYLFAISYRMLGAVQEAEDAVQEAYLRMTQAAPADVRSERAYLTTLVTRICIDRLKSAVNTRQSYIGPWLPEPILDEADPADVVATSESLSMAFLVVLESLGPLERAVFLLREVFGYEHSEIASIVQRTEANVRQIAHRARENVAARRPRFVVPLDRKREIGERFVDALRRLDLEEMLSLVSADITMRSDGGGRAQAALRPIEGADKVLRFLAGISKTELEFLEATINGQAGLIVRDAGVTIATVSIEVSGEQISEIFIVTNPEKLGAIRSAGY